VLQGLDITLTPGVYALVGKNGAGKSTLMQILTGILSVDEGEILLNGVKIHPQDSKFSKMIGYLPQDTPIYKNFSAEKFLCYLATVKGVEKKKRLEKVKQSLEMVNLEKSSHTLLKNFSGGMKRRIGIAQLLLDDSAIIIVDEPTVGLDPKERIRFYNILSTISKEK
jgi:ABC-type multidrug transport system, ATPase component